MRYAIYEANMERLEKKMIRIKNKCQKFGCDFIYEKVGEEYREIKDADGNTVTAKFILIDAEGVAKVNGWRFIASVDATENGNIINRAVDVEVPEHYYHCEPHCEHCNVNRYRRYLFIVQNEETGEFKMVGKACLKDFTNGMDAGAVASYTAMFEELIEGEEPMPGCRITKHYNTKEYLRFVIETIRHFGYVKSERYGEGTKDRAADFFGFYHGWFNSAWDKEYREKLEREIEKCGFDAERAENYTEAENALAWLEEQAEDNNYIHNLKVACSLEYVEYKHFGLIASLMPTYNRDLERQAKIKAEKEANAKSEFQGKVGDRINIAVADIHAVTGWSTQFGYTYIYRIVDNAGNVYTWKTQKGNISNITEIKGTVKAHNEYRGVKQTELTRCKIA